MREHHVLPGWVAPLTLSLPTTASLKRLARQGFQTYVEEPRSEWVLKQPAQLVIAVSQIYWCANVEEKLRSEDPNQGLESFLGVCGGGGRGGERRLWQP